MFNIMLRGRIAGGGITQISLTSLHSLTLLLFTTPEMEFLNSIFVAVSGHKLVYLNVCLVFYPLFSVLHDAIHEQTRVFLFPGFFYKDFENRLEFLLICQ
jgi:hypothetical protein